jgi:SAM-dependent methyltransferase
MHGALATLDADAYVLDLGCGRGSFRYATYAFHTLAMDLTVPETGLRQTGNRIAYLRADSRQIPLGDHSVDMVVSHHTMEHFPDYRASLSEIGRILKPRGFLWIAVPDGYSLDDTLYRKLFAGGGHVNRFRRNALIGDVAKLAGLPLVQSCALYSGFVYLRKPAPPELPYFPRPARALHRLPRPVLETAVVGLNTVTRLLDKVIGTGLSHYGWGFLFSRRSAPAEPLASYFNVCRHCGSGSAAESLAAHAGKSLFGLRLYACPHCGERNVLVPPPAGTV